MLYIQTKTVKYKQNTVIYKQGPLKYNKINMKLSQFNETINNKNRHTVFISIIYGKSINDIDNKDEIDILNEGLIYDENIIKEYYCGYIHIIIESNIDIHFIYHIYLPFTKYVYKDNRCIINKEIYDEYTINKYYKNEYINIEDKVYYDIPPLNYHKDDLVEVNMDALLRIIHNKYDSILFDKLYENIEFILTDKYQYIMTNTGISDDYSL